MFCLALLAVPGKTQNITNKGTDFWVGYGHHQFMEPSCNGSTPGDNSQNMVLYISTEQPAIVTVTIDQSGVGTTYNNSWWRRTYNIPANTVINTGTFAASSFTGNAGSSGPMPKGGNGTYDSRLITDPPPAGTGGEGIFLKKGIHIESNVPITAYAHIYGSVSSGATMLLPTNAWGYSYGTINSQQGPDVDRSYNWVYVIAKENNTKVEITPAVPSRLGKPAGVPFTVTLQKGQIYQLIGQADCPTGTGPQLTGTRVKSIANASGQCYPIAVFAGSSRTMGEYSLCGSSGRDNDMQECFPMATWGKRYLTAPAAKSQGSNNLQPSNYQTHVYKVLVKDPTTKVKVNGSLLSGLINNSYYQFKSGTADYIEADKPIMVGMFFSGASSCGGSSDGDPEMLYLSPIEQAIKQIGLFRNNLEVIYSNWVNIIIPTAGINSLVIDGIPWSAIPAAQKNSYAMTNMPGYSVAVRGWPAAQAQVTIASDSVFNAFTYGLGSAESYGFNAGCYLNNLSAFSSVRNTPDTTTATKSHPYTFVSTPTQISALITYKPTKIVWKLSAITPAGFISPNNGDQTVTNPVPYDSVKVGAAWQYYYKCPGGPYTFSQSGTYYLPIRLTSPDPDVGDCNNEEEINLEITVKQKPFANFTVNVRGCGRDTIAFNGPATTSNGYVVKEWSWLITTGSTTFTSNVKSPSFVLDPGTYSAKLTIIVENGGVADTTINFVNPAKPVVDFTINPNPACPGPVNFVTNTTYTGTPGISSWYWNLDGGTVINAVNSASQTKTYPVGVYTIKHSVKVNNYCIGDTVTKTLTVSAGAMVDFTYPQSCVPASGLAQFTSNASNQPGITYTWTFGDPGSGASNTSTAQNPTHVYATNGTYSVRLQISTAACTGDTTFNVVIRKRATLSYPGPLPAICRTAAPVSVAQATADTSTGTGYYYDASGATSAGGMFNPSVAGIGTHTIWYVFTTSQGCKDSVSQTITVNAGAAKPTATTPVSYCQNSTATALSANAGPGNTLKWYTSAALTNGSTTAPIPSTATAGTFYYYVSQVPPSGCESDTATITVIVTPAITADSIAASQTVCSGTAMVPFTAAATITGGDGTYAYQWQQSLNGSTWTNIPGATNAGYDAGTLATTTYFRRTTTSGLCSSISNVDTITIVPALTNYNIASDQTICSGTTPSLIDGQTPSGTGPFMYTWESSLNGTTWTAIAGATSEDYQPGALTTSTQFRRTVVNGPCSATSNVVTITVNPLANGSISAATAICSYDYAKVKFTATAGTAPFTIFLSITGPSGSSTQSASVSSGDSVLVIPVNSAAGTYTVKLDSIRNSNGCIQTTGLNSVTITVTQQPVVTISANPGTSVCAGVPVTLTASGATSYTWTGVNLSSTTGATVTASPTATGQYLVEGVTNGCTGQQSITVNVYPRPAKPTVVTPVVYCQNATASALSATATSGNTLTWYNNPALTGGSNTAPVPSTATAGTTYYYVNQFGGPNNCTSDTSTITVIVQPSITNNTVTADQTICSGTSAATLNGAVGLAGGDGNFTYQWQSSTNGGATWSDISGATTATYTPGAVASTTSYRRVVTAGQCSNTSAAVVVTVVPAITNYNITADQSICEGVTPAILNGQTPSGAGPFTYSWESSPNGTTWTAISGANGVNYQPAALTATTYFRRITVNGPCSATSNAVQITVKPLAAGSISGPGNICQYQTADVTFTATTGTGPFTVVLTITNPAGGTSTITQSVNSGGTINVLALNSAAGTYTVTFTSLANSNGCVNTTGLNSINIVVTATPNVTLGAAGPICEGKSANLSANGATSYAWSATNPAINLSATTGASVTASPSAAGSYPYQVQGTTNGCSATANGTLVVNPRPGKPSVVTPVSYCQLGPAVPLQATATGGNTLTWYNTTALTGGFTSAPTPSTANAGNIYYYVTQANSFGCESDTATTTIIVSPGISGNAIAGGESICQGSTPQTPLTNNGTLVGGSGTYTYQWQYSTDNGNTWTNISGATGVNYSPGTLNTTTQFRRVVSSGLCGSISNVITETVLIGLGNYDISASQTVCEGAPVALLDGQTTTGTGPFTYTWQQSPDGVTWTDIPSSNTEDYQPPALTSTTFYRRKVTNGPCTGFSSPVQITVKALANGNISAPAEICVYESAAITFNATVGTAPFNIALAITNPGGSTSNLTPPSMSSGGTVNVIPVNSTPGTYTIKLNSITSNGCTRSTGLNTITIVVKPMPSISVPAVAPICKNDTATVMATGADTYAWTGAGLSANTGATVKASPASTTTYSITGTTNGCSAQVSFTLTVNPRPNVNISVADNDICLTEQGRFSVTATIDSGSVQNFYWDFDNGNTQVTPGSVTTANPQTYASHRIYVTKLYAVSDKNCASATDTAWINVNPMPVAAFGTPSSVCLPNNVATFTNQSTIANGAPLNYLWNYGDPASGSLNNGSGTNGTHVYPDSANYSIQLSVVSAQGCADQATHTFNAFFRKPVAKFGVTPDTLCQGIQNLFLDSSFAPGSNILRRLWLFGDGNSLLDSTNAAKIYTRPGDYRVALVVQSTQGCTSDTAYKNIKVYLQPVIDAGPSFVVPAGTTVTFNASANSGQLKFAWTSIPSSALLSDSTKLKPQYVALQDAHFILTATGQGNCKAWDSLDVRVLQPIHIPNAFSPNGDGINDKWDITNLKDYPNCVVEVYNRYGQVVHRSFGYTKPWDGSQNGKPLPVGTYYYIIEPKNGFPTVTGYVVIVK